VAHVLIWDISSLQQSSPNLEISIGLPHAEDAVGTASRTIMTGVKGEPN
jgi:hypothetical protein